MNWALLCAILFIFFVLFALWHNSLFSKAKVELKASFAQKVVYRIVNGNEKTIKHEQKIYNKRARSLWGKEMRSWATFRIYFPLNPNYGVFGIFVPNDFKIDEDCLKELGFVLGELDYLKESASVEIPMRSKLGIKLNRLRAKASLFAAGSKNNVYAEIHDWKKHRQTFVMALGEFGGLWIPQ